jgi:hypothetical protein
VAGALSFIKKREELHLRGYRKLNLDMPGERNSFSLMTSGGLFNKVSESPPIIKEKPKAKEQITLPIMRPQTEDS